MSKAFSVIEFPSNGGCEKCLVEAVPSTWVSSDKTLCRWPKKNLKALIKIGNSTPEENWTTHQIRRIFATYGNYNFKHFIIIFQ